MKARILRNLSTLVVLVIGFLLNYFIFKINPSTMTNLQLIDFKDYMNSVLSFSSLVTAFLFFTVSFIPVISEKSPLFKTFKTDLKMLDSLLLITFVYFIISIYSLIYLLLSVFNIYFNLFFSSLWMGLIICATYALVSLFFEIFRQIDKKFKE